MDPHDLADYAQPDFYHFAEDSLFLVQIVAASCGGGEPLTVLDLGAGCGILGIELSRKIAMRQLFFCEKQNEFIPYLEQNISQFVDALDKIFYQSPNLNLY